MTPSAALATPAPLSPLLEKFLSRELLQKDESLGSAYPSVWMPFEEVNAQTRPHVSVGVPVRLPRALDIPPPAAVARLFVH
eukprot:CAMPEP_0178985496 /NCGR_PEP_ID=MMETSP0795-20121207/2185_1 /TAXON_ID=88552 /ORGANISM="Amoebophrya sp., Strain Ameob2" /LENGTH=80 /DNA_ID=CAMNT_0020676461 /DNA_START=116 /DNA_END=359 /DNA_ORIENTATION=-